MAPNMRRTFHARFDGVPITGDNLGSQHHAMSSEFYTWYDSVELSMSSIGVCDDNYRAALAKNADLDATASWWQQNSPNATGGSGSLPSINECLKVGHSASSGGFTPSQSNIQAYEALLKTQLECRDAKASTVLELLNYMPSQR